jgi:hypothetical protein
LNILGTIHEYASDNLKLDLWPEFFLECVRIYVAWVCLGLYDEGSMQSSLRGRPTTMKPHTMLMTLNNVEDTMQNSCGVRDDFVYHKDVKCTCIIKIFVFEKIVFNLQQCIIGSKESIDQMRIYVELLFNC